MQTKHQAPKALFLDRDGVINKDHGYVFEQSNFEFIEGIFKLCKLAQKKGYLIFIVTNQSGIARSFYSKNEFKALTKWYETEFWKQGVKITRTLHCPHHPNFNSPCTCRKPRPGMIHKAQRTFRINLSKSIIVGDRLTDMQCGQMANIKTRILFTPNGKEVGAQLIPPRRHSYFVAQQLYAIQSIL